MYELEGAASLITPKPSIPTTDLKAIEAPPIKAQLPTSNAQVNNAVIPYEANFDDDLDDIDWLKVLCEAEDQNRNPNPQNANTTTDNKISNTMMQRNSPMFSNCKIGNININITKK